MESRAQTISTPYGQGMSVFSIIYLVWSTIIMGLPPLPLRWYGFEMTVKSSSSRISSMVSSSLSHDSETVINCTFFSLINVLNWLILLYRLRGFKFKITGSSNASTNLFDLLIGFRNLAVCFLTFLFSIKTVTLGSGIPLLALSDLGAALNPLEKNQNQCFYSNWSFYLCGDLIDWPPHHWPLSDDSNSGSRIYNYRL